MNLRNTKGHWLIALIFSLSLGSLIAKDQPNIILICADDAGFEEVGFYGVIDRPSITPNIDSMAKRGVAFSTCYAQAICGPSRAMLKTGNYANRTGAFDNKLAIDLMSQKEKSKQLPHLTKVMKSAGYHVAVTGKWHHPVAPTIINNEDLFGVDDYLLWHANKQIVEQQLKIKLIPDEHWEIAAISKLPILSRYWKPALVHNGEFLKTQPKDFGPDMMSDFVCDTIRDHKNSQTPFFAFYTAVLPHSSHCVTPFDVAKGAKASNRHYRKGSPEGNEIFSSQVRYLDHLVGKIIRCLEETGQLEETVVIFTSDNGTTSSAKGKGTEYGVHVPFVVMGPGIQKRGMVPQLMDFTDVLPTLADFGSAQLEPEQHVDGISLKPFLLGRSEKTKPVIYSFPGVSRVVRTEDHLLEAVCPFYGFDQGRFYKTNGSFDGRGYENITHHPEYKDLRNGRFQSYLDAVAYPLPGAMDAQARAPVFHQ